MRYIFSKGRRFFLPFFILGIILFLILNLSFGSINIPFREIVQSLLGNSTNDINRTIIWSIRFPRVLVGFLAGASLSAVGCAFQGLLKNPLADPYILGISSGGAFGAVLAIALQQFAGWKWFSNVETMSFFFALISTILTYFIASTKGKLPITQLVLSGIIVNLIFSSATTFIIVFYWRNVTNSTFWLMGSLSGVFWNDVLRLLLASTTGIFIMTIFSEKFNAMSLGEEEAMYLGVNVERFKLLTFILGSFLTSIVVSTIGIVGFVGLIVPHMARFLFGANHRISIPASALLGGMFLVGCDSIARSLFQPTEMPIGIITAFIGAPVFIFLLKWRLRN
ncbi:MAG: cobalamin transport system permease protein [Thermotogaceae bacterium]|jgi:iron complex transport system permease protein|nr:cobalamin transport system permease protein [Thermotogaceae bacterium]MDN5338095.1 cobalamin transport system permease protein [Thermotogaceae bacterium]